LASFEHVIEEQQ